MSNPFYLHPDLSHLEADDPRAAVLVAAGAAVAGAATWGAEHAAERAAELRAELVALDGFHPVKRRRIAAELAALDAEIRKKIKRKSKYPRSYNYQFER